jgi:hypothetical protein
MPISKPKDGVSMIEEVMGPPKVPGASPDPNEADEGGEGELSSHLRAFDKAMRSGNMAAAESSFRAAVSACGGYSAPDDGMMEE